MNSTVCRCWRPSHQSAMVVRSSLNALIGPSSTRPSGSLPEPPAMIARKSARKLESLATTLPPSPRFRRVAQRGAILGIYEERGQVLSHYQSNASDARTPTVSTSEADMTPEWAERALKGDSWLSEARCRGIDPNWFHPKDRARAHELEIIAFCNLCPVQLDCAAYGYMLTKRTPWASHGWYGGMNTPDRERWGKRLGL